MQKVEKVYHKGTFIGSIMQENGFFYAFQAHAFPGQPAHSAHYPLSSKKEAKAWLIDMQDSPVQLQGMDYMAPGPRLAA